MFHTHPVSKTILLPLVPTCPCWTVVTGPTLLSEGQGVTSPCVPKSPWGSPSTFINEQLEVKHQQQNNNNDKGLYFNDLKENVTPRAKTVIKTTKVLQANWSNLQGSLPKAARQRWPWALAPPQGDRASPASPHANPLLEGPTGTSQPWGSSS